MENIEQKGSTNHKIAKTSTDAKNYQNEIQWKKVVHKIFKKKKGHQAERLKHQSKGKSVKKNIENRCKKWSQ